jgi:hypothetical protein
MFFSADFGKLIAHRPEQLARPCRAEPRGAVDPVGGQLVSLFVTYNDTEFFQFFLGIMAAEVRAQAGKRPCWFWITRTGTSRNRSTGTISRSIPDLDSPDFNASERLLQHLKGHHPGGFLTKRGEEVSDKRFDSISDLPHRRTNIWELVEAVWLAESCPFA